MKKMNLKSILALFMGVVLFASCSDDDDNNDNSAEATSRMSVKLVDAPGDYDAVNIDVQDVVIKYEGDETEYHVGEVDAGIYDLLELTGGQSANLAINEEIPAGDISQIRLVLGTENTVVIDGETMNLQTPSAQQSGLKINLNETLEEGILYEYVLDFDVEASIVEQGNGGYLLKPVIRASKLAVSGIISGTVIPSATQTLVTATSADGNVVVSTYTDTNGNYTLYGLPEGSYTLTFTPEISLGLEVQVLEGIDVDIEQTTAVEVVTFQ
ncbi:MULTISPECIES: DUF4382 domain-containing protein [Mesonia]|uniref:Uncharacterized protein n=1 Tax=Mesonia oceanica TaxID=2687242 RepID=A0AC61Y3B3_9FLAO|nr:MULTISPECIES: DUF4382 domain-containing protein [Mesonia]VVU98946.1 hypothetical protein FVB9532_00195 [Mesonia oceanica]|tara:strand:+ start:431 stop:1237 length:807 start_codon:yes stop_codon:yes gene_type:complete